MDYISLNWLSPYSAAISLNYCFQTVHGSVEAEKEILHNLVLLDKKGTENEKRAGVDLLANYLKLHQLFDGREHKGILL